MQSVLNLHLVYFTHGSQVKVSFSKTVGLIHKFDSFKWLSGYLALVRFGLDVMRLDLLSRVRLLLYLDSCSSLV